MIAYMCPVCFECVSLSNDSSANRSQLKTGLKVHALYSLRGRLVLLLRLARAAGRSALGTGPVSPALSSEERSNTPGMNTPALISIFSIGICDRNAAMA